MQRDLNKEIMSGKNIYFKLEFPKSYLPPKVEIHARHDATWHRLTETITESLFDAYIDDLIRELEQIRQEGKHKFAAWHSKSD
jgi:hypothetical protein